MILLGAADPAAPTLALAVGLALIEAIDEAAPGRATMLKWPNDLLLDGAKLAGILLERAGDRVVAGFGVNLAFAPDIPGRETASLDGALTPEAFAPILAASMARNLASWRNAAPGELAGAWQARAHPVGTDLVFHSSADDRIGGSFDGLDADGALRLRRPDGRVDIVRAGDVSLANPPSSR